MRLQPSQCTMVVINQLSQPGREASERKLMAAQNQMLWLCKPRQTFAGFEPIGDWISLWFSRVNTKIRTDRRNYLITRQHNMVRL